MNTKNIKAFSYYLQRTLLGVFAISIMMLPTISSAAPANATLGHSCSVVHSGSNGSIIKYPRYFNTTYQYFIPPTSDTLTGRLENLEGITLGKSCYFSEQPIAIPNNCLSSDSEEDGNTNYLALITPDNHQYCLYKYDLDLSADSSRRIPVTLATVAEVIEVQSLDEISTLYYFNRSYKDHPKLAFSIDDTDHFPFTMWINLRSDGSGVGVFTGSEEIYLCPDANAASCPLSKEEEFSCEVGKELYIGTSATSGPKFTVTVNNCNTHSSSAFSVAAFALPELEVSVEATVATALEEGQQAGEFTITRSGNTDEDLTVEFTLGGTATNGVDYNQVAPSVTIAAGESSATVEITPIDDQDLAEPDETVTLTLIDPVAPADEADIINGGRPLKANLNLAAKVIGNPAQIIIINYAHLPANSHDIPTLQEWALILLSLLLFITSRFYSRKQKIKQ